MPVGNPLIYARYRGPCRGCDRTLQTTIRTSANAKQPTEYRRCRECGTITELRSSDTKTAVNASGGEADA